MLLSVLGVDAVHFCFVLFCFCFSFSLLCFVLFCLQINNDEATMTDYLYKAGWLIVAIILSFY
jgi:hypothetical protein